MGKLQIFGNVTHMLIHKTAENRKISFRRKENRAISIPRLNFRD